MRAPRPLTRAVLPLLAMAALLAALSATQAVDDATWSGPEAALAAPVANLVDVDMTATGSVLASRLTGLAVRPIGAADLTALARAVEQYGRGRISEGDRFAAELAHGTAREAAEWAAIRSGAPALGFARIVRFLETHPGWGELPSLQRRAEEAMVSQRIAPERVLAFFATRQPASPAGRAAHALALQATSQAEAAMPLVRALWRDDPMGRELEVMLLAAFGDRLTRADHRDRMDMYLFKDNAQAALRSAERGGPELVRLAQARIAVARKASNAQAALDAVPPALRSESAFLFAQAQYHRRRNEAEIAARLIAPLPRDATVLVDGDEWWVERRLIARQLLDKGLNREAHAIAAGHAAERPQSLIEAEWHAGWIALRFLAEPALALGHFETAARHAETPISRARTSYWRGRALEALGRMDEAKAAFAEAAHQPIAYYGQIARARLGLASTPLRQVAAIEEGRESGHPALAVVDALEAAGRHEAARPLILELSRVLEASADLAHLASVAQKAGDARLLVNVGKAAVQRGLPFDHVAYPVGGMPPFESVTRLVERAMVFAIARQESAFDPEAVSHAGARGLMQMMLATARETARRTGVPFEAGRLTSDPAYNAQLGAAHLGDLMREWRGSYILAFAAYNAGSGNVRDWIAAYGDPRSPEIDPIDWVERIPFTETRNYVQRVMENLQVYRERLGDHPVLMIGHDLRRGARGPRFAGEITPN